MRNGRFEGWYLKHQLGRNTVALIPGCSESGAFVQILAPNCTRYFTVPEISVADDRIRAGNCLFSLKGCKIDLPGVRGEIAYEELAPLKSDIMGPFRFFPMECRHGVISMAHRLQGGLTVDGVSYCFDGGRGYMEKDSGVSFPSSYQWLQCNDFAEPCSVMVSIARIPFCALHFTGCICAILYRGREYRLATYKGVKIISAGETQISLSQGDLQLNVKISSFHAGHALKAPADGRMTDVIRERVNAKIHIKLWEQGQIICNLRSSHATYEYVAPPDA
jgi:tocopherol cyclase